MHRRIEVKMESKNGRKLLNEAMFMEGVCDVDQEGNVCRNKWRDAGYFPWYDGDSYGYGGGQKRRYNGNEEERSLHFDGASVLSEEKGRIVFKLSLISEYPNRTCKLESSCVGHSQIH